MGLGSEEEAKQRAEMEVAYSQHSLDVRLDPWSCTYSGVQGTFRLHRRLIAPSKPAGTAHRYPVPES